MHDLKEYQAALQKDGKFDTYDSAPIFADTDDNAIHKAKQWTSSIVGTPDDAWLVVAINGRGIATLRPGSSEACCNRWTMARGSLQLC
jgi:hypothetical protein